MNTVMLAGATGLVGAEVLKRLLADARVDRVVALTRRPLPEHTKLVNPIVNFDALASDEPWWKVDSVICTLGTTIRAAGSQAAFRRVDHGYPLTVATLAHRHGATCFALNSARGADPESRIFYSRIKGEVERDIERIGFRSLTIVRPGLIGGERAEKRTGEHIASLVLGALAPVLPRRFRINPASHIAEALVSAALAGKPGKHVVFSEVLV